MIAALRAFVVARTIRNLRGQAGQHASMLVNASRFTGVQNLLRNRLHEIVDRIESAVRRSEERRAGKECASTCRSRWSPYNYNNKNQRTKHTYTVCTHIKPENIRKTESHGNQDLKYT